MAFNEPAANIGGDFYGVFSHNPYEVYFAIGDVSGKGMPAALVMAQTLSAMQFVFASTTSPADALTKLNATLFDQIVRGMFVTALIGRLTPSEGRIELASAGHCRPILCRASGGTTVIETPGALPLGVVPRVAYRQGKLRMQPGDWLIGYTDGLSESRNAVSDAFFEEEIQPVLAGVGEHGRPQAFLDALVAAETAHRGPRPRADDLTILAAGLP